MLKSYQFKWLFAILFSFSITAAIAQADKTISGGYQASAFVTTDGQIYVIGNGTSTPTKVNLPNNLKAKQVSVHGRTTFVVIDCNGDAWSWGNNTYGQLGNGTTSTTPSTTPTRVKAGPNITVANKDANGNLINATTVVSSFNNCFIILKNGTVASWGKNSIGASSWEDNRGQLGDSSITDKSSATLVIDGSTNKPLLNVSQISACDNVTFALINGIVYSWGNGANGQLGRGAKGGVSINSATQSSKAYPVCTANGLSLKNIVKISASAVTGMALDKKGYVWTWGMGGWNNVTGHGNFSTTGIPSVVLKGSTVGKSNDGTYLLAKDIDGGQGFAMAVTIDGAPVAWGGGGCASGGATGNGTLTGSSNGPAYILTAASTYHKDVININGGSLGGFYIRADNSIYAWGCNSKGELGLNNTSGYSYATKWTAPSNTFMRDPFPKTNSFSNDTIWTCESTFSGQKLSHNFKIDTTSLGTSYSVNWYFNGNLVKSTTAKDTSFLATKSGKYKVEVSYKGTNGGCSNFDVAKDSVVIMFYPKSYTVPNLNYCSNITTSNVHVNSNLTTNPIYNWYASPTSSVVLGKSIGSNNTLLSTISIPNNGIPKIVYVEEKNAKSGIVFRKKEAIDTAFSNAENFNNGTFNDYNQQGFTITEPLTIDTMSMILKSDMYTTGTSSTTFTIGIYGSYTSNGSLVADKTNLIKSFTYNYVRTKGANDPQTLKSTIKVPVNVLLPTNGVYFISIISTSNTSVSGTLTIMKGYNSGQTLPIGDNVTGNIIQYTHSSSNFQNPNTGSNINQGHFFDIKFSTGQQYCDRSIVELYDVIAAIEISGKPKVIAGTANEAYSIPKGSNTKWTYTGSNVTLSPSNNSVILSFAKDATSGILNAETDTYCGTITKTFKIDVSIPTGIESDNSTNSKVLTTIYNLQGIEVNKTYQGIVIYRYSDGTTLKTIQ